MRPRAKRSLGQNFLQDDAVVQRIIAALELTADDRVIEIGPGHGALTERLVAAGADVTAIEFDRDLVPALRKKFEAAPNIKIHEADALDVDFHALDKSAGERPFKLVANLPYNISTPILQRLIDQRESFSKLVLMFQREVVERIVASPCGKERGFLSVISQNAFEIEYLFDVSPEAFRPVPKVWSSVIRLTPRPRAPKDDRLRQIASRGFAQKRKTLVNNMKGTHSDPASALKAAGLSEKCRAEELSLDEWKRLLDHL